MSKNYVTEVTVMGAGFDPPPDTQGDVSAEEGRGGGGSYGIICQTA